MYRNLVTSPTSRRIVAGIVVTLGGLGALTAVLVPFRAHLSIATPALVFVIPVIVGVVVGGIIPGALGAVAGFLAFDLFFVPPYNTLTVSAAANWVALLVYVVVVLLVAQVVTNLQAAREVAQRRGQDASRLFELSQALIGDLALDELLEHIATTVDVAFAAKWTAILLPGPAAADGGGADLFVAASAGDPLSDDDLASLTEPGRQTRSLGLTGDGGADRVTIPLLASNRAVGLLVLQDVEFVHQERALLETFANQAALAIDRTRLLEQALRSRLLEEVDRWRGALMGAVSHDLRTPLASVKTAVSSLRQSGSRLAEQDRADLLELIELQSDRLARLVTNLLDMTRIESGALQLRPVLIPFDELVGEALSAVDGLVEPAQVACAPHPELPLLEIDQILIVQVLANLLENAARLSPLGSTITVDARRIPGDLPAVEIAVADNGPGIGADMREQVFEMFSQNGGGGRAGLGLAIAKSFVEAHGGTIWIDPNVTGGARVVFTVPAAHTVPLHG
jgi:two-component system sensor histidine kinase KdpD